MRRFLLLLLGAALMLPLATTPARAQFSDSYNFLKAVREGDMAEAAKLLSDETSRVVNTRDSSSEETALIIVTKGRNLPWINYLMARGASPKLADKAGMTPLMHATLIGFADGAELLLIRGAPIDQTNNRGETALILAVQKRNVAMIRLLVERGANPNRTDYVAGMSARDYAKRDDRSGTIVAMLDAKPAKPLTAPGVFGPK